MKVYKIGHFDYDDYGTYDFIHSTIEKTEEEFEKDCNLILNKYFDNIFILNDRRFIGMNTLAKLVATHINELGYESIGDDNILYAFYGSCILRGKEDEIKELLEKTNKDNIEKIFAHNTNIKKSITQKGT
jgi:hypothetical protein